MNYYRLCQNEISFLIFIEINFAINLTIISYFLLHENGQAGRNMCQ
jgi:hypothetical protein